MKNTNQIFKTAVLLLVLSGFALPANAQFLKKIGKVAEKAAERAVERRVDQETEEKTDEVLDEVFEESPKQGEGGQSPLPTVSGSGPYPTDSESAPMEPESERQESGSDPTGSNSGSAAGDGSESQKSNKTVNRAPDFEPGALPIFEDDFSRDAQGDFPAQWDTNGSGEIVLIEGAKWFRLGGNTTYVPLLEEAFPENYTIEFDLLVQGIDKKTSSQAFIKLLLEDTPLFTKPRNMAMIELSPCIFIASRGVVEKVVDGQRQLRNEIGKDYRDLIDGRSRISIAVNKTRMRVWMNDNKLVDVPRLVPEAATTFKIQTKGLRDDPDKDEVYITNFRIGQAGVDNRSKLISEGRMSTTAIQFESGSDALLPESYKVIREVAEVLEEHSKVSIKIIGHTDAEGDDATNLELSKKRALAVKTSLEQQYGIATDRIETDGKGEAEPVGDNASETGRALNRRVEFIKI